MRASPQPRGVGVLPLAVREARRAHAWTASANGRTTTAAVGDGNNLAIHKEIHFPHSLGLLYSAFTYYTGFKVNSGEYKLMGLAPYGEPRYAQLILDNLIDLKAGRLVPAQSRLFQLLHRADDDQRAFRTRCSARRRATRNRC